MASPSDSSHHRGEFRSRPHQTRAPSVASAPYIPNLEALILPEGNVGDEATALLQDLIHTHPRDDTLIGDEPTMPEGEEERERAATAKLPWWKRPSPYWLMVAVPFTASSMGMTMAPRVEIYTVLACAIHRPEYAKHLKLSKDMGLPYEEYAHDVSPVLPLPPLALGTPVDLDVSPALNDTLYFEEPAAPGGLDKCASDPQVQATVASLTLMLTVVQGILACLTTGWWGALSDRRGRKLVMGLSVVGLLYNDLNFLGVALFASKIPGGYWLLLVGPVVEGIMGGMTSGVAAMHAYVSDTTEPAARSRTFSLFLGLLFIGIAAGPTLGALIIRASGSVLSVFFVASAMHFLYAFVVWVVLPESRGARLMRASKVLHAAELAGLKAARHGGRAQGLLVRAKAAFAFLSPLLLLLPRRVPGGARRRAGRDWSLTLVAAAYGLVQAIMGAMSYKFQYALAKFAWTSEDIGYYLTLIGVTRAAYLMLVLPLTIKLFGPKSAAPIALAAHTPNTDTPDGTNTPDEAAQPQPKATPAKPHSAQFDLNLTRFATFIDLVSYVLMGLADSALPFTAFTLLGSMGTGFAPGIQAVALALYARRGETETGKLFGALSVVNALCAQIIGPALFGFTYIRTVAIFPATIFMLSGLLCGLAFCLLLCVNLSKHAVHAPDDAEESVGLLREETLVGDDEQEGAAQTQIQSSRLTVNENLVDA
ncbi:MFS general substrate transporter [Athelia psychrophila]|uniref:MFS general substrate transporter n=1 Tax=Athelia psychrophila TaxID=1759441 RepID=A0A166UM89_9AGAM|nr:MFS general substrate transporter [Fibularhizoctonia sp. CBS 109695]